MASRTRENIATYFDVFCEVKRGIDDDLALTVLYPHEYSDENVLRSIKQFTFPYDEEEAVQLFTFVLTDAQSQYTFGYCRYTPRTDPTDVESLLTNAYHLDIPEPGAKLRLNACTTIGKFVETVPDFKKLPSLREDKFMLEFYNAVSERQMIPLAPMPYIIGVPKQLFKRINRNELGDVVIVDLEEKTFESPFVDILPAEALNFLRGVLKSSAKMFSSDGLARAFLQTNVIIFGKYSLDNEKLEWDRQIFVNNQRPSLQSFLNSIIGREGVQYFERFIEERLNAVNSGSPIFDEFEKEIEAMGHRKIPDKNSKHPEALQQAVKDNANDVIGALKDKVQAISIKETFGRFTPSEVKRRKLKPPKKKRLDPLFVDAAHYDFNNPLVNTLNGSANGNGRPIKRTLEINDETISSKSVSDAESVNSTGDLIDLSDIGTPTSSTNTNKTNNIQVPLRQNSSRPGWETFD